MMNKGRSRQTAANSKGQRFMTGGLLLILAAVFLTGYNLWDTCRAEVASQRILALLTDMQPAPDIEDTGFPDDPLPDYLLNPDMDMPTALIDGNPYVGILTIPALQLSLPVMSDWSYPKLKIAPNRYQGSAYTDSLIIAGHNYHKHLGGLKDLSFGDEVVFIDVDANKFHYTVTEIEIMKSTETERMAAGEWDLTMFTCTLGGEKRVTVRCERTSGIWAKSGS